MSFESLNKDELTKVALFFTKDVEAADPEKGPTKKELVAALAAGDDPVSWDDYKEVYLESDVKKAEDRAAAAEEEKRAAAEADPDEPVDEDVAGEPVVEEDESNHVLIKMDRKNGTYETHGLRFTKDHPYKSVPEETAEAILKAETGFRLALPSEVKDYYN